MIQAKMILDSICPRGNRLRTLEVIMPRYILAEYNTHRMLSKNSASSRAIPLRKMLLSVMNNPFIPYAFQEDHKGMQGTKYLNDDYGFTIFEFRDKAKDFFKSDNEEDNKQLLELFAKLLNGEGYGRTRTLKEWWLFARDKAVEMVAILGIFGVTKQLANRLLEPFMYHKVLVSGTEWDNFFNLRCPDYIVELFEPTKTEIITHTNHYKSWKDLIKDINDRYQTVKDHSILNKLKTNKGQADIHMMFLAEAIWDATNESTPVELKEGEWHAPYADQIDYLELGIATGKYYREHGDEIVDIQKWVNRISIARCARLSYQTLGDNPVIDYEKDLELYESLSTSGHWSPFEHVAKVMTEEEYYSSIKGKIDFTSSTIQDDITDDKLGWCRNYKGFIQYRDLID